MNRFTEASRDNFKFGGILNYFTLCLTDNLTMANFLTLLTLPTLLLTFLNMFSEVPRGQIKEVINFAFWSDIHWYGLAIFLHDIWWIEML